MELSNSAYVCACVCYNHFKALKMTYQIAA